MSYLSDFIITAERSDDCSSIEISDLTSYPYSTKERDELAIALFWTIDDWTSVEGYNIENDEAWSVDLQNNKTFKFRAYLTPIWDSGGTYNAGTNGMILFHYTEFYQQSLDAPSGEPGAVGTTGWDKLDVGETGIATDEALEALFETALKTGSFDYGYTDESITISCSDFVLSKADDHEWTVTNNSGNDVNSVELKKYDGEILDDELEFDGTSLSIDLDIYEGGGDGVYILKIAHGSPREDYTWLVIYDFSDAENCYVQLFRYVICKCSDPCDVPCNEQNEVEQRKNDMILIKGLMEAINKYIYVDMWQAAGVLKITDTREKFISQVGDMIDKLSIVVGRCGTCDDDETNTTDCS